MVFKGKDTFQDIIHFNFGRVCVSDLIAICANSRWSEDYCVIAIINGDVAISPLFAIFNRLFFEFLVRCLCNQLKTSQCQEVREQQ